MKELLPFFTQPSHYLGIEYNSVHKDLDKIKLRWALAFPDLYEVGMSYTGQAILYQILNSRTKIWAERVFAPNLQVAKILREDNIPLTSLESDTPLSAFDIVGFSLTHELCYTTILYMLDLAGIPLRSKSRNEDYPLIMAGGGALCNPEPVAPFFEAILIGDGEEAILKISDCLQEAKNKGLSRLEALKKLETINGLYIPSRKTEKTIVEREVLPDLNQVQFPSKQIVPFGKPVHDRFTLEIARGCTRGCRFCQAGMVYRPVRERSLENLDKVMTSGLSKTGFEDMAFLSLSSGDFSQLESLFALSFDRCQEKQVSISLPSLRVGSLQTGLIDLMARLGRTGATLAPEAGNDRLRKVINKDISEQDLLVHSQRLFELGWTRIKLYFMIGLPTETIEDVKSIFDLTKKVLQMADKKKRPQVTASISPFVPKPQTPFQWERQDSLEESRYKIEVLKELFTKEKRLHLRWQQPEMSILEGVFSRGDSGLAEILEHAYSQGDVFTSWQESFSFLLWQQVFEQYSVNIVDYLRARNKESKLPWDFISTGLNKEFLLRELNRSKEVKYSPDCRYNNCLNCGTCSISKGKKGLAKQLDKKIQPIVNLKTRDQDKDSRIEISQEQRDLGQKAVRQRLWFSKLGPAKYLSQLELQKILERTLRRADVALSFSRGFNPKPLISFGRALPVGVSSLEEWFEIWMREYIEDIDLLPLLNQQTIPGIRYIASEKTPKDQKKPLAAMEEYELSFYGTQIKVLEWLKQWNNSLLKPSLPWEKQGKKGKKVTVNLRTCLDRIRILPSDRLKILLNWTDMYINPLSLVQAINPGIKPNQFDLCKIGQYIK